MYIHTYTHTHTRPSSIRPGRACQRCPAATDQPLWVNSLSSGSWASFNYEFRRFEYGRLEVESLRCTGHLEVMISSSVGRLLEADVRFWNVREFLRMFASEAKQPRNDNRDSSRTVLAMNLGTKHTTYKRAGARNVLNGMCKYRSKECGRRAALGTLAGILRDTAGGTNYCR